MTHVDSDYAKVIEILWGMEDSEILRYINQRHIVKNPRTEVLGVFGFLNTSKIDFAFTRTKVESLRKINFLSIKDFGMIKILTPLYNVLSPYYQVEVIGNSSLVYHVKQPKHVDRRWLNLAQNRR